MKKSNNFMDFLADYVLNSQNQSLIWKTDYTDRFAKLLSENQELLIFH